MVCQECVKLKLKKEILWNIVSISMGAVAVVCCWGLATVSVFGALLVSVLPIRGFWLLVFPVVAGIYFGLVEGCGTCVKLRDIGLKTNALEAKLKRMK